MLTPAAVETAIDVLTLVGMALLAVPALRFNQQKKDLTRLSDLARQRSADGADRLSVFDAIADELEAEARNRKERWRRLDELCLFAGYGAVFIAALGRVLT